jgi:hypothetical protein
MKFGVMRGTQTLMLCMLAWATTGCDQQPRGTQEIARISSPDKQMDLVVTEVGAGATVSTPYKVYLVAGGKTPSEADLILKIDKSSKPEVAWLNDAAVVLKCERARVWNFRNFGSIAVADRGSINVSVSLECGHRGFGP